MGVGHYNNKRGDQKEIKRQIINLTIKNGRSESLIINGVMN